MVSYSSLNTYYITNEKIRARELRVIADKGENLGVLSTQEALRIARERELDLVLIAPEVEPPVAKILDFKKFLYDERKRKSAAKAKVKKSEIKELKFGPSTGVGDMSHYIERAKEFIKEGNRVKITVVMRGREAMFPDIAFQKLKKFEDEVSDLAKSEAEPRRNGNMISEVLVAK
jgi:translation initiation factor IF-3